ncbi:MAG: hypothetical protein KTR28_05805 [Micavibrio sp.]|nr:hypothetical protein [Micavibrio sp.]
MSGSLATLVVGTHILVDQLKDIAQVSGISETTLGATAGALTLTGSEAVLTWKAAHREHDFRISVAGAQEKTALLLHDGKWLRPSGTTPTTHIFKTQIVELPNGIDLSNSVERKSHAISCEH